MSTSLAEEINTATRSLHKVLNQLLLHLLPLALPPHTSSPHLYADGISHFFPIYSHFESSITSLLHPQQSPNPLFLRLHFPELERSSRLRRDLVRLLSPSCFHALGLFETSGSADEGARLLPYGVSTFIMHIHESISAKPHVHIAYTWVFYMALFSGGRYIRDKLRSAGDDFWAGSLASEALKESSANGYVEAEESETAPLSFWNFPGAFDGEDLKAEYKSRVREIEPTLTLNERQDIINEAVDIMKRLINIVHGIERAAANGKSSRQAC